MCDPCNTCIWIRFISVRYKSALTFLKRGILTKHIQASRSRTLRIRISGAIDIRVQRNARSQYAMGPQNHYLSYNKSPELLGSDEE